MEIKWSSQRSQWRSQWRSNIRAMQRRIKDRLCITSSSHAFLRQMQRSGKAVAYAKATGLVGARVFKGNVIFARALHTIAKQSGSGFRFTAAAGSGELAPVEAPNNKKRFMASLSQITDSEAPIRKEISQRTEATYTAIFGENSQVVRLLQAVAVPIIGNVCHAFMRGLNHTEVYGVDKLMDAVLHRPQGQALITVSNHVASMDDPLVLAAMLPPRLLLDANCVRWTLCATDRCFTNAATSAFFRCVKVLPLARGGGVQQKGIDLAVEKLKKGDWVHIFPEGSRSRDGGKTVGGAKRGIGRLVLDTGKTPLVVPFVHSGMQEVMPIGSKFPSIRKKVMVLVGDPIELDDLITKFKGNELPEAALYEAIALRVGQHLKKLKVELDRLVLGRMSLEEQQILLSGKADDNQRNAEWGAELTSNEKSVERTYLKESYNQDSEDAQSASTCMSEDSRQRKSSFEVLEEGWLSESRLSTSVNFNSLQEGMITRLRAFMDPAVFVGFAAQGILSCNHHHSTGRNGFRYSQL